MDDFPRLPGYTLAELMIASGIISLFVAVALMPVRPLVLPWHAHGPFRYTYALAV